MKYFKVQLKRAFRLLPAILLSALALILLALIFAYGVRMGRENDERNQKLKVGYVGTFDEYMGISLDGAIRLVASEYGLDIVPMTIEEAKTKMKKGELSTYILIPDGIVDALDEGNNELKIVYVTDAGQIGITGMVMRETVNSASKFMVNTEAVYYAGFDLCNENGKEGSSREYMNSIDSELPGIIQSMLSAVDFEAVGISDGLGFYAYYLVAVILAFVSISGLSFVTFFNGRNGELQRKLLVRGNSYFTLVLSEFTVFLLFEMSFYALFSASLGYLLKPDVVRVAELGLNPVKKWISFSVDMIPAVILLVVLQFLIYELTDNVISSLLSQLFVSLLLGFASGLFYPVSFLPERMVRITSRLPIGLAISAGCDILKKGATKKTGIIIVWIAVMFVLCVLIRRIKLKGSRWQR